MCLRTRSDFLHCKKKTNKNKEKIQDMPLCLLIISLINLRQTNHLDRAALYNPQLKYMKCMNILKYIFIYLCNTVKCGDKNMYVILSTKILGLTCLLPYVQRLLTSPQMDPDALQPSVHPGKNWEHTIAVFSHLKCQWHQHTHPQSHRDSIIYWTLSCKEP